MNTDGLLITEEMVSAAWARMQYGERLPVVVIPEGESFDLPEGPLPVVQLDPIVHPTSSSHCDDSQCSCNL